MQIELRLQELGGSRRFNRGGGSRRRSGHASWHAHSEGGIAGQNKQSEANASSERPRETSPPTHQDELNRISRREIPVREASSRQQRDWLGAAEAGLTITTAR